MPLTSTRPVSVYLLYLDTDRDQLADDHAKVGWTVAEVNKPGATEGSVLRTVSMQFKNDPDPIIATFDDVIVSDLVMVQAMTRAAYNTAHPEAPLP